MKKLLGVLLILSLVLSFTSTVWAGEWSQSKKAKAIENAQLAIKEVQEDNGSLKKFFDRSYGYAIFPTVGKGGIGLGGAYGEGVVYQKGQVTGFSSLMQISFGFQLGGQAYTELIFFETKGDYEQFTSGEFKLGAAASAVAIKAGVSTIADYENGIAVMTATKGGLMYEATVSGQKFDFMKK